VKEALLQRYNHREELIHEIKERALQVERTGHENPSVS
jgi:hypothetical protein